MATLPTTPVALTPEQMAAAHPNAAAGTPGSLDPTSVPGTQGAVALPAPTTSSAVPAATPAAGGTAPTPTAVTTPTLPSTALQPGNTGDGVKALQDYLVANGYMTQDQVNTGYGTYGPQTTAAVQALQQKLGVDNTSDPGYFGPKTIAAVAGSHPSVGTQTDTSTSGSPTTSDSSTTTDSSTNDPYAGMNPVQKQTAMYQDTYKALGLPTIKQQYDDTLKQEADLNNELQDKILKINNDPWLSEGIRTTQITKLQDSYQTRLDTFSHLATLYDSMYKEGTAQADHIVTGANADMKAISDLAQKKVDAATALAKDNQVVSVGGRELLVNRQTGKTVADLGPSTKSVGPAGTAGERAANAVGDLTSLIQQGGKLKSGANIFFSNTNKQITPAAWKELINAAPENGLDRQQFIDAFKGYLYLNSDGTIPKEYGLQPVEEKGITGVLSATS